MDRAAIVRSFCRSAAMALLALSACGSDPASNTEVRPAHSGAQNVAPGSAPGGHPVDPTAIAPTGGSKLLDSLDDIDDTPEPAVRAPGETVGEIAAPATLDAAAPPHGCVVLTRTPTRVLASGGPASIAATPAGFVVAGYMRGAEGESVVVVRLSPSTPPYPLATLSLGAGTPAPRLAPPTVATLDNARVFVAAADTRGSLRAVALSLSAATARPELRGIGSGADLRFAPAVAALRGGAAAVAYTDGNATPMRVRLVVVRPDLSVAARHDLTPESLGASAPVVDVRAEVPVVVFLVARGGLSRVVRVALGEDGTPRPAQIDRPLSTVSEPAHIAAAHIGPRRFVAYTAIGRAATSAIGLVELGGTLPAEPLVPGEGYGVLQLAAVSTPGAAVFLATRPAPGVAATERFNGLLLARVVDEAGIGPALQVSTAEERIFHASLARGSDGTIGVAYTTTDGVSVVWMRCDDR